MAKQKRGMRFDRPNREAMAATANWITEEDRWIFLSLEWDEIKMPCPFCFNKMLHDMMQYRTGCRHCGCWWNDSMLRTLNYRGLEQAIMREKVHG